MTLRRRALGWRLLAWLAGLALLALVLRRVPLGQATALLRHLTPLEILALVLLNAVVLLVLALRWRIVVHGLGGSAAWFWLAAYRLAGFAVSYFTPGTQFGGEPLQVYLLHRRHKWPGSQAAASVTVDKALELLGNFTFLLFGLLVSLNLRLISRELAPPLFLAAGALLGLPVAFLAAMAAGIQPLTRLLQRSPVRRFSIVRRVLPAVASMEEAILLLLRRKPGWLVLAMGASLLSWVMQLVEVWVVLHFLELPLGLAETIGVVTAGRLALLVPVPAGLGALEVSQVLAFAALGYPPGSGLAFLAVVRARDLLLGACGLALGAGLAPGWRDADPAA